MTHTYQISGMTCSGCEEKVRSSLASVPDVTSVTVSHQMGSASINMNRHIPVSVLQNALGNGRYQISATESMEMMQHSAPKSWLKTYKPILTIFGYITAATLLVQSQNAAFDSMQWMRHFMAGFFLVFSFFKMLDLQGFAESYAMYDVVALKFPTWGYLYAFIELALGLSYLCNFMPIATHVVTLVVMSVSLIGVLQSVLNKRKIQCACLGAVFDLPMSTVTIVEDALMILMSGAMLTQML